MWVGGLALLCVTCAAISNERGNLMENSKDETGILQPRGLSQGLKSNISDFRFKPRSQLSDKERQEAISNLQKLERRSEVTGVHRDASNYSKHEVSSKVSVVIKTFERPSCLLKYLRTIRAFYPEIPILIADDSGHVANTSRDVMSMSNVRYFPLPFDTGVSAGRNFLLDHVKTPFFVLSDDDNTFTDETKLENLLADIETSGADVVGACNREPEKSCVGDWDMFYKDRIRQVMHEHKAPKFSTLQVKEVEHGFMDVVEQRDGTTDTIHSPHCKEADMVANFFLARTAFVDSIRWDPYFKVGEHEDFFYRAKLAHAYIRFCTNTAVSHEHKTCLQDTKDQQNYKKFRNRAFELVDQFFKKHDPITRLEMPWATVSWECACDDEYYSAEHIDECMDLTNKSTTCRSNWDIAPVVEKVERKELEIQDGVAKPLTAPEQGPSPSPKTLAMPAGTLTSKLMDGKSEQ